MLNNFQKLKNFCENENFRGWDPYDGLSSVFFQNANINNEFLRLIWIQVFKRSLINLRNLLGVKKDFNPKGLALFVSSYCNLYKLNNENNNIDQLTKLSNILLDHKISGFSGACWGYNFDWQSRAFFLPKDTPNVVTTSFAAQALMDAYDITNNQEYLDAAIDSTKFIINDLNRHDKKEGFIFSYSPLDNTRVYNASLLGTRLLSRAFSYNKDISLINLAKSSANACANEQNNDGSWIYGELDIQNWVDSFHTGYNIECLNEYQKHSNDNAYDEVISKGLNYYTSNFIEKNGAPKYYNNRVYPIDMHCPAQFIITMSKLKRFNENKEKIDKMLEWVFNNMFDSEKGHFYFQKNKFWTNKIPYMRWTQAWMFLALTYYLLESRD